MPSVLQPDTPLVNFNDHNLLVLELRMSVLIMCLFLSGDPYICLGLVTCKLVLVYLRHGLHNHSVLCFVKCYVKQAVLLKISGRIFTSHKAQIVEFVLSVCIRRYIYQTCRVFSCREYVHVLILHLNDDTLGYRHYRQCSKVIDKMII